MSTSPVETASEKKRIVARPLGRKTLGGTPYTRGPRIEAKLEEVLNIPSAELVERCGIQDREDPGYIPSECLLHVVRTWREDDPGGHFESAYKLLMDRVLRKLPTGESSDGKRLFLPQSRVREELFDCFVELLARDRTSYNERLDYFEVRFDGALANLRRDVQRKAFREPKMASIEPDSNTGEMDPKVEAALSFNPFDPAEMTRADYRSRLNGAINTLPAEQRAIIEMIGKNIPIDSIDPGAVTIAKTLGKSEKTIRLHRDQAYSALEAMLKADKML